MLIRLAFIGLLALPAAAQQAGLPPDWESAKLADTLATEIRQLKPLLDQIDPKEWVAKGAPEAYVEQWKSVQSGLAYFEEQTGNLKSQPHKLSLLMETYFQIVSLQAVLGSLEEGLRRWQNPALAELLHGTVIESFASRDKLRQRLTDVAAYMETEFEVVSQEAQRCRAFLSKQPAPPKKEGK